MLLEAFHPAVRDDTARPQIAQLSELGLVELTRKRQARTSMSCSVVACPSCGGLGHCGGAPRHRFAPAPATVSGLRALGGFGPGPTLSALPHRIQWAVAAVAVASRGGRSSEAVEAPVSAPVQVPASSSEPSEAAAGFVSEPVSRRQEPRTWWPCRWRKNRSWSTAGLVSNPTCCSIPNPVANT